MESQKRAFSGPVSTWDPQPAATAWVYKVLQRFRDHNQLVSGFEQRLSTETGTRLFDWIDHLALTAIRDIETVGFRQDADGWFRHPGALLPAVRLSDINQLFLRVDFVSSFVLSNSQLYDFSIMGEVLDQRRTAIFRSESSHSIGVIERHGCTAACELKPLSAEHKLKIEKVRETLRHRRRHFPDEQQAYAATLELVRHSIQEVGRDLACALFFEGERAYWMSRNRAGRVQYMRQNALGLGWGNHDHHTYRSSRPCFSQLIELLELLGFQCRERFYAGAEAGWGAQVLEQPIAGVVIFADVDLAPSEITGDFAHEPLSARSELGTIGLWCALHGEAMFEAGMHHLECQFDFDGARSQLEMFGVKCMKPFTDFSFLRQCFTEGERWPVRAERIERALNRNLITAEQAARFKAEGAVGSHLEVLERNDGYRGFNQTGINDIIRKTDPRFLNASEQPTLHP